MTIPECQLDTIKHIERVRHYIHYFTSRLYNRGVKHDSTKLEDPEVQLFAEYTPKLKDTVYNSEEYQQNLKGLQPALDHHYAVSQHHPEHFVDGINDMTLIDIVEMFCDWKAATERHTTGNLLKSIEINAERFAMSDQLKKIFMNTAAVLEQEEK